MGPGATASVALPHIGNPYGNSAIARGRPAERPRLTVRSEREPRPDPTAGAVRDAAAAARPRWTNHTVRDGGCGVIERLTLYATNDGRYLTGWQLRRRVAAGDWTSHLVDRTTGTVLVETDDATVIGLTRIAPAERPDWLELRSDGTGVWVADRRRTLPPSRSNAVIGMPTRSVLEERIPPRRS